MNPVVLENVSKAYRRYAYRRRFQSLKSMLLGRDRAVGASRSQVIQALDGVSFSVPAGSTVGIIGSNGSGKSTLLKLIAGISRPTSGTVTTSGRIAALIELGAGFHPEISGRENVFINGIMLGLSKQEINRRFEEIVRFAGLEEFIDAPVKTYSSGMYMRLGFSVAVHVDPEILLIDEILAVGDEAFSHKCIERIRNFQRRGKTIVLVTHSLDMVEGLCDRAIWIDDGTMRDSGDPRRVIDAYLLDVAGKEDAELLVQGGRVEEDAPVEPAEEDGEPADVEGDPAGPSEPERRRWGTREIEIGAVTLLDGDGSERYVYQSGEALTIRADIDVRVEGEEEIVFGIGVFDAGGICCFGTNTDLEGLRTDEVSPGPHSFSFEIASLDLVAGTYFLDLAVHRKDGYAFDYHRGLHSFRVRSRLRDVGIVRLAHRWSFSRGLPVSSTDAAGDEAAAGDDATVPGGLDEFLKQAREAGRKVVFTNGCFDLLHSGHIRVLQRARAEGDLLVVGLNSDESVHRLKGDKRPILPQEERCAILSALECVDRVIPFDEDTPLELIRRVMPDVLVKGGDWTAEQIVGREDVEAAGGRVEVIPLLEGRATTAIIETIRQRFQDP